MQAIPGGHVVGSQEGPLPPQVGPHEQVPESLSVHVSPGGHAPPQVGAVPSSQRVSQVQGLVPVAVQTFPGGHVVGSQEGPSPAQVGPHEQPPESLSVQVSPGGQAPPQVGAVPWSHRVWQVQALVPVAVQTIPTGQVVGSQEGPLPAQVGPHEQPPDPLSVQVSPAMQSPLHMGAVPALQIAART